MDYELIDRLKPHVSTFSLAITKNYSHGDEIYVGGIAKTILDMTTHDSTDAGMVQIDLDDVVGVTSVLIPYVAYKYYRDKYDIKLNDILIAKGKLYMPNGLKESDDNIHTILCWELNKIEI